MRQLLICIVGTVGCIVAQTAVNLRPPPIPESGIRAVIERVNTATCARTVDNVLAQPPNCTLPVPGAVTVDGLPAPLEIVLTKVPAAGLPVQLIYQGARLHVDVVLPVSTTTDLLRKTFHLFIPELPRSSGGQDDVIVLQYWTTEP